MVRGLNTTVSYSMDSFVVQQFEDLFDRGKAGGLHSYKTRSEFVEECLKQFSAKFDEKLNIHIETPHEVRQCKECGAKFADVYSHCPACQAEWKP